MYNFGNNQQNTDSQGVDLYGVAWKYLIICHFKKLKPFFYDYFFLNCFFKMFTEHWHLILADDQKFCFQLNIF